VNATRFEIALDVGGTFTDCVAVGDDGTAVLEKAPTTPHDQSEGVIDGLGRLAVALGLASLSDLLGATARIVHGTTTADNAMIEMRGAPTGLIVTEGFRDEIEFRRCFKEDIWDPTLGPPEPIARRRVRLEVRERATAEGDIETPLDEPQLRTQVRRLAALGVTSIAVVFLHSYRNAVHELRARDIILEEFPGVDLISLSHEVLPKPPEFERTSTTLVNAYVGPPIVQYLARLEQRLREHGYTGELLVATCSGGVATPQSIARRAVATINSGPTGGVVAAARAAASAGLEDVVSVDMGGTSYDVCLIRGGRPDLKADWNWRHRYCIALPMVDIHAIGAGGGSIAHALHGGLQVGPASAGAHPGPVAYGRGGTQPTVTDADLVLGRIDAHRFWGGRLDLDFDAATNSLVALGADIGIDDPVRVAADVVRLVEAHMTDAIRRVLALAGADPRSLDLVAFGGMGGLHAASQAAALGMRRVLVPALAPGFSAAGLLQADHVIDRVRSAIAPWQVLAADDLDDLARELRGEVHTELDEAGVPAAARHEEWFLNLVYPGQTFDTSIAMEVAPGGPSGARSITPATLSAAVGQFHRRNEAARLIEARAQEPVVRGVRVIATGRVGRAVTAPRALVATGGPTVHEVRRRPVWFDDAWHDTTVVRAETLSPGDGLEGPALVESDFTVIALRPGDDLRITETGDALITIG
jgi:N-methylhydantoinase A